MNRKYFVKLNFLLFTIYRYLTVCHPFYYVAKALPAKLYVIPIILFSFGFNVPKFFELETAVGFACTNSSNVANNTFENCVEGNVTYSISPTSMRMNRSYYTVYCIWLNILLNGIGPFVLLITLNTLMLIKIKKMIKVLKKRF